MQKGTTLAKCQNNACVLTCATDQDCSPSGVSNGITGTFNGNVCVTGVCQTLNCSGDSDCNVAGSGALNTNAVHMFCETTSGTTTTPHYSAVTN